MATFGSVPINEAPKAPATSNQTAAQRAEMEQYDGFIKAMNPSAASTVQLTLEGPDADSPKSVKMRIRRAAKRAGKEEAVKIWQVGSVVYATMKAAGNGAQAPVNQGTAQAPVKQTAAVGAV